MRSIDILVIGGGISGQLVQVAVPEAEIFDWHPQPRVARPLTRHFGANYLWEPLPGIDCRSFRVVTHIDGDTPTLKKVIAYKNKIGKPGDIGSWQVQFQEDMTGYDFISLPTPTIHYNHRIIEIDRLHHTLLLANGEYVIYGTLISTIPLYSLLSLLGMNEPADPLRFDPIFFKVMEQPPDAPFNPDVMYVNYLSNPDVEPYRFCDRFGERHYESIIPFAATGPGMRRFIPGKIHPNPQTRAICDDLNTFSIYTFGRFANWNPDELVHETYRAILAWRDTLVRRHTA